MVNGGDGGPGRRLLLLLSHFPAEKNYCVVRKCFNIFWNGDSKTLRDIKYTTYSQSLCID